MVAIISSTMTIHAQISGTAPFSKSDESDDICRIDKSGLASEKNCNLSRDYLDIAKISRFHPDPGNVTLMMIFHGVITEAVDDESIRYVMWFNTSYGKTILDFSDGVNSGYTYLFNDSVHVNATTDVTITENTIQVTYPVLLSGYPDQNIEAYAVETKGTEHWIDRVPSVKKGLFDDPEPIDFENPNQYNDSDNEETPGFTTVVFILVVGLMVLMAYLRRL